MGINGKYLAEVTHGMNYFHPREKKKVHVCLCLWLLLLSLATTHILPCILQEQNKGIICYEMAAGLREEQRD